MKNIIKPHKRVENDAIASIDREVEKWADKIMG